MLKSYFKQMIELRQKQKSFCKMRKLLVIYSWGFQFYQEEIWRHLRLGFHWDNYFFLRYWSKKIRS